MAYPLWQSTTRITAQQKFQKYIERISTQALIRSKAYQMRRKTTVRRFRFCLSQFALVGESRGEVVIYPR